MNDRFYIVDDDKVIQRVLKNIIIKNNLGDIIGFSDNGKEAIEDIKTLNPDIVLVDLLLPDVDGIGIVSRLRKEKCDSVFIMISEVNAKDIVSKAYKEGIELYINKPINVIEVISVIKKVKEKMKMTKIIKNFEDAMETISFLKGTSSNEIKRKTDREKIETILAKLGILGEAGNNDIVEIVLWLENKNSENIMNYKLSDLYSYLNKKYKEEYEVSSNVGAIEQRIRRAINKGLKNIANIGIEDYSNDFFSRYASILYDFTEVRKQMDFARGKSKYSGKVNIKKFLEGILISLNNI
ncbi:MAG: response regulator [Firmicutes bacterium]|nr:response regulator [Bacillota bacterium]